MRRTAALPAGLVWLAALAAAAGAASAEEPARPTPEVGYEGTPAEVVELLLDAARVGPGDVVYDLGSGDGRIVIAAARRGARGLGVEIDPDLVALSRANAAAAGLAEQARFELQDLFALELAPASVVTLFLLPELNVRLRPRLLAELAPGSRVVSHMHDMGDWRPDRTASRDLRYRHLVHLWIVPARVAGRWKLELAADGDAGGRAVLELDQTFQVVSGRFVDEGGRAWEVDEGHLDGRELRLTARRQGFLRRPWLALEARIDGSEIDGSVTYGRRAGGLRRAFAGRLEEGTAR